MGLAAWPLTALNPGDRFQAGKKPGKMTT